jgi:two-component sensor histidine kinase
LCLCVADDCPAILPDSEQPRASGLGLVRGLATQLGGAVRIESGDRTHAIVEFPAPRGQ